jgi:uncharacterized zinc-type alcohol dehydrogenase-like protein
MLTCTGYAAASAQTPLAPLSFERRDPRPTDVQIDILFCGVCHSDLHQARNEWRNTEYPCVPGHEIVGRVAAVGAEVKKYKTGDLVGVGCMVDSCRRCEHCQKGLEQFCLEGCTLTYNGRDRQTKELTKGGYSQRVVVDEAFVLRIPEGLDPAAAAPLLCAGITTYSPLRHWKAGPGKKVGVVGLGGLGHMAVKIAHAMGAHVVLFTTSPDKVADGKRLGADDVILSKKPEEMKKYASKLDLIIDTVAADHDIDAYLAQLRLDGSLVLVGLPEDPVKVAAFSVVGNRRSFSGSAIGGIPETQEMLDFCAKHGLGADIEMIPIQKINEAYERLVKNDVKYRFVIDIASLK